MRINQIFNNNVVGARTDKGQEVVVMGRGVGFQAKPGDVILPAKVEKVFSLGQKNKERFRQLLEDIPFEHLQLSDEIIAMAKEMIGKRLSENVYLTLTDHVSFAIERYQQGIFVSNAMLWEIRNFYGPEFQAGKKAVEIINSRLKVELGEDEAGFIALHLVNAELDTSMRNIPDITHLIRDALALVEQFFQTEFDTDSLSYRRFTTHLRYLGQRVFRQGEPRKDEFELGTLIRDKYSNEYACAEVIADSIASRHGVRISDDNKAFLAVHIRRVTAPKEG
ncbi:MAG: PRD domain-containing protein [Planctomycetes bacterium]|nr:PRD domain-containing protein [Planctomycetota bacterium]